MTGPSENPTGSPSTADLLREQFERPLEAIEKELDLDTVEVITDQGKERITTVKAMRQNLEQALEVEGDQGVKFLIECLMGRTETILQKLDPQDPETEEAA